MKSFIVLAMFVAVALASPVEDRDAQIVAQESDNIGIPEGYKFYSETSNGIKQQEQGQIKNLGAENEAQVVQGSYSYTGPDGVLYSVEYVADENGFQARGAHIPQAN